MTTYSAPRTASSETSKSGSRKQELTALGRRLSELEGQHALLTRQLDEADQRLADAADSLDAHEQAVAVLEQMEGAWRRRFEDSLSQLVSHGLTAVFGEPIRVTIERSVKRDTTHLRLLLEQDGVLLGDIVEGTGGSIVSLLSILLRVLLVVSVQPPLRRVIVLDEAFRMVEPAHLPAIGSLLRELSDRLDVQFLVVSHEPELADAADVVFEVEKGKGTVRQIKTEHEERS